MRVLIYVALLFCISAAGAEARMRETWCEMPSARGGSFLSAKDAHLVPIKPSYFRSTIKRLGGRSVVELSVVRARRVSGQNLARGQRYYLIRTGISINAVGDYRRDWKLDEQPSYEIYYDPESKSVIVITIQTVNFAPKHINVPMLLEFDRPVNEVFVACHALR